MGVQTNKKRRVGKYTTTSRRGKNKDGWTKDGRERFGELRKMVLQDRVSPNLAERETCLMEYLAARPKGQAFLRRTGRMTGAGEGGGRDDEIVSDVDDDI